MTYHRTGSEKKGGGRKTAVEQQPQLLDNFLAILAEFTAGDPMREGVLWTNLSRCEISRRKAKTSTGLKVTVDILTGIYETGKKCATDFIENMRIVFNDFLPRWNYRALPQG